MLKFRLSLVALLMLLAAVARGQAVEGFTEPFHKVDLIPPEPGTISDLNVREGDRVKKDQLLGSLDSDIQRVAAEIARANMSAHGRLDSAVAERDLRKWRLAKLEKLHASGHANDEEVTRAETELRVAESNVLIAIEQRASDALEYDRISAMLERRMLRSPFDGVVTRVFREEKESVSSNNSPVLTVMQLDKLRATFSVPTQQATRLKVGQIIPITFPDGGQEAMGKIEFISPITEAESDTVRVKVIIDNPKEAFRCGVRCSISTGEPATEPAATK